MFGALILPLLMAVQPVPPSQDRLADASSYVFRGRILKPGASTMPEVAGNKGTAVVLVEEVYHASPAMPDMRGKEITVNLAAGASAQEGLSHVFFTNVWLYGKSLAARETGRLSPDGTSRETVAAAYEHKEERALKARIQRAAMVVSGRILSVAPLKQERHGAESEHDPMWWTAVLQVEGFAKGQGPRELTLAFPSSEDELWSASPKFKEGQEGVWILQKGAGERGSSVFPVTGYTALDPRDVQPKGAWERIRKLASGR